MNKVDQHERKAERFAAHRIREIRGDVPRVVFGKRIGLRENALYGLENGLRRVNLGRLAYIAHCLDVPLSSFILPDDENHLTDHDLQQDHECMEEQA